MNEIENSTWKFIWSECIVLISQFFFFGFGWLFYGEKLFKDYEIKKITIQLLFAITFTLSCSMFELIIFEILDIIDRKYIKIIINK